MIDPIVRGLKVLRQAKGLSQQEVAEKAGIGRSTIAMAENGRGGITLTTARMWAEALGWALVLRPEDW